MSPALSSDFDPLAFHGAFRPSALACTDFRTGERYSYRELHDETTACARRLVTRLGATTGARIAVISRNSARFAIIALACERAGAILVPLNWRLTPSELSDLLTDAAPIAVIAEPEFETTAAEAVSIAGLSAPVLNPNDLAGPGAPASDHDVALAPADMRDPAVILYTSGTTGKSKGVVITRENLLCSALNFIALAGLTSASVLLCDSPMFHTVGLVAVSRSAFLAGACVHFSDKFLPSTTLDRLGDSAIGVTHYFVVPQMIEALLAQPDFDACDLSRLTALFSGGGPLPPALIAQCQSRDILLVNGYGMSEVGSAIHMPLDATFMRENSDTVGFPAPYISIRLAGPDGAPVAAGEIGEIWISGPSVSPGYWNQADATAASRSGDWFRTGDCARQKPNGAYMIVDRLKDMYITGGENVYPAEIERAIRQVAHVDDAAVIGVPDERWGEAGVAFVQTTQPSDELETAIRTHCQKHLARYKQPSRIHFLSELPRTSSGKIRKNILLKQHTESM